MKRLVMTCSVAIVILAWSNAAVAGVLQPSSRLPPTVGEYVSFGGFAQYGQDIDVLSASLYRFTEVERVPVGPDVQLTFGARLDGHFSIQGVDQGVVALTGPVSVMVRNYSDGMTGTFQAEIVSMSLSGSLSLAPVQIREDMSRASTGQTTITDVGGGLYHIDSFFDVFTELSADGGASLWPDVTAPARLTLTPEPATLCLVGLGALAVLRRRRR